MGRRGDVAALVVSALVMGCSTTTIEWVDENPSANSGEAPNTKLSPAPSSAGSGKGSEVPPPVPPVPDQPTRPTLQGGQTSITLEHPEIGSMRWDDGNLRCTATLIQRHLVLTAAHCVNYQTRDEPGTKLGWFRIDRPDGTHFWSRYDGFGSYGKDVGRDDVAVLRLIDQVPADVATPAKIATSRPTNSATIYGYGCTQRNGDDPPPALDVKQRLAIGAEKVWVVCQGDSGGPTLIGFDGPVYRVTSGLRYGFDFFGLADTSDLFGDVVHWSNVLQKAVDDYEAAYAFELEEEKG